MPNLLRLSALAIICTLALFIQACGTLNGTVPFKYVPSLASGETINLRAGLQTLADERPEDDRSATESIADVPDKVTAKLIEDFRASQVFATLDFPIQQDKDDLILQGAIKRFYWKMKPSPITFIP